MGGGRGKRVSLGYPWDDGMDRVEYFLLEYVCAWVYTSIGI